MRPTSRSPATGVYRATDQFGQVIDVLMSTRRDAAAARRFFKRAIRTTKVTPIEVVTDRAPAYLTVLDDLLVQNRRRGHYELAVDEPVTRRVAVAFSELTLAI